MTDRRFDEGEAERRFHRDATYFKRMVDGMGGLAAAKQLLGGRAEDYAEGFTTLWEARRLELSVEFFALLPEYAPLFEEQELSNARWRLREYGFDVDAALDRHAADPAFP